ncbi:MAG TPA: PAS domain-containing protein, partial [Dongiaceae bacterium]|nr:PAS domain-containing protein [Dongiaceae bacterium]
MSPEVHRDRKGRQAPHPLEWRVWLGPLLAVAFGALDVALMGTPLRLQDAGDLQVVAVVIGTLLGGVLSGIATALVGSTLLLVVHTGHVAASELWMHVVLMVAAVPVFSVVGRMLHQTAGRQLRRTALLRVLEHYRTLLEDLGAVVWEFDRDEQRITTVSDSVTRVLGHTPKEWMTTPDLWQRTYHPDDLPATQRLTEHFAAGGREFVLEHRMIAADGHTVWLQTAMRASNEPGGHAVFRGVTIDVSEHKRAGAELQHALSLLTATLDATG